MNDFTKEELKHLLESCEQLRNECGHDNDLIDKLQSMIDNYCEHEWVFYISPRGNIVICNKCNREIQ